MDPLPHVILGTAPVEGRIGVPNACCSIFLPTEIFDVDIRPDGVGPRKVDRGQVCVTA
ncbi:acetamidase/formamidase family protein [Pseudonocardia nigra]|uniref:acetamidase/formamidase family protein n=1 Tax=Pseudonocardia nigra TaxID=1921578 RepID=UPI001C5CFE82|nr:acetamidase/formamidase family protein [Pseudonocardia nigra]